MKRNNKKGFTIVELVIVIAVIAILSAVLIPTFSGIVKKARISSDTQVVRNMNTSLSADAALNGDATDFGKVRDVLYDDGYVLANLNPTTDGWFYVWESESNQMLLVTNKYKVHYPQDMKDATAGATWYFAVKTATIGNKIKAALPNVNVIVLGNNTKDLANSLAQGGSQTIYIDESIKLDGNNETLVVDKAGSNITIDLGESTLKAEDAVDVIPVKVDGDATLNMVGGKFEGSGKIDSASEGKKIQVSLSADNGATLNVENTEFTLSVSPEELGSNEGGIVTSVGDNSSATLKNVKATIHNGSFVGLYDGGASVTLEDCQASVTCTDGRAVIFFGNQDGSTEQNEVTIKSGSYSGYWTAWFFQGGALNIEGGDFTYVDYSGIKSGNGISLGGSNNVEFFNLSVSNFVITITGGTFQGVNYKDITEEQWKGLCRNRVSGKTLQVTGAGTDTVVIKLV